MEIDESILSAFRDYWFGLTHTRAIDAAVSFLDQEQIFDIAPDDLAEQA